MGSRHCRTKDSLSPLSLGGLTALITSVALLNILPTINTTCIFQLIIWLNYLRKYKQQHVLTNIK